MAVGTKNAILGWCTWRTAQWGLSGFGLSIAIRAALRFSWVSRRGEKRTQIWAVQTDPLPKFPLAKWTPPTKSLKPQRTKKTKRPKPPKNQRKQRTGWLGSTKLCAGRVGCNPRRSASKGKPWVGGWIPSVSLALASGTKDDLTCGPYPGGFHFNPYQVDSDQHGLHLHFQQDTPRQWRSIQVTAALQGSQGTPMRRSPHP